MLEPEGPVNNAVSLQSARRFRTLALALLAVYAAVLLLSDKHEAWPFSRFPMFSVAKGWHRSLVRELSAEELQKPLSEVWENELPGQTVPLHRNHINQDDLSAVLRSFRGPLSGEQADFLARYFESLRHDKSLVLYRADGGFRPDRSIRVRFTPVAIIDAQGARDAPIADAGVDAALVLIPLASQDAAAGDAAAPDAGRNTP